eukprot:scaffold113_cov339-Pavlova_lutheri.AAC.3
MATGEVARDRAGRTLSDVARGVCVEASLWKQELRTPVRRSSACDRSMQTVVGSYPRSSVPVRLAMSRPMRSTTKSHRIHRHEMNQGHVWYPFHPGGLWCRISGPDRTGSGVLLLPQCFLPCTPLHPPRGASFSPVSERIGWDRFLSFPPFLNPLGARVLRGPPVPEASPSPRRMGIS